MGVKAHCHGGHVQILEFCLTAPTVPIEFAGQKESRKCSLSQIMGKSRKYSKGHATGFVPDFRHAVETMGESEGLGNLGRVDNELTMSEISCAPKRKRVDESFDVPFQLLSLTKMARSGRKDLTLRLKSELEEVRKLQKKIAGMSSITTELSPYSDIRSCSVGEKRPPLESLALHGKKRPLLKHNGPKTKRSISGRFISAKSAAPVTPSYAVLMKQCETLLKRVMSHQFGKVFDKPVDIVKWNIPDYFTIIKHPMDLGTVKSKLISCEYTSLMDFAADVRLTFSNAMSYNPPGNDVHVMAETLSKYFETRWKPIEKILAIDDVPSEPSKPTTCIEKSEIVDPPVKKKKITPNGTNVKPEPIKRIMTGEEKQKLSMELDASVVELPENIIDFLKEQSYNASQINDDEIEIDIDALSDDTLFKLRKLLDDFMLEKQKTLAKPGPCEIQPANESGFSNSLQQCEGNEPIEEEVDIVGGDDPPLPSYPPAEIENGGTNKTSEHSSSSSSSESGSSSSGLCYCILLMCFPTKGYVVCTLIFIACIQNLFVILISCRW